MAITQKKDKIKPITANVALHPHVMRFVKNYQNDQRFSKGRQLTIPDCINELLEMAMKHKVA